MLSLCFFAHPLFSLPSPSLVLPSPSVSWLPAEKSRRSRLPPTPEPPWRSSAASTGSTDHPDIDHADEPSPGSPRREASQEMGWAVWATLGRERPPLPWAGETLAVGFFPHSGLNLGWVVASECITCQQSGPLPLGQAPISEQPRKNVHCREAQAFADHGCLRTVFLSSLPFVGYNSLEWELCSLVRFGKTAGDPQSRTCSFLFMQWFLHL